MKYTVLLLRPDYKADCFGTDTFMDHVEAMNVQCAEETAQVNAMAADYPGISVADLHSEGTFLNDYAVLAVLEGHHTDIKTS